ncbi:o-succinylbenzoate synthase [Naasia sp. SYSU D00948]|uniref:o-succinylbenzoate synthase n=1 Tax=Naasia sp. SYSU D00948 TaxID=2817379 RepID=UPI001B310ED0|nr:o-succinylbenzoate synthase [Naasia sp. SYSU D00948]
MTVPLEEVLADLRVVDLPMRRRFRGITRREAALVRGPQGWAEFSPFPEYGDAESARWLAAALDFGWTEQPELLRSEVRVNATVPAVAPGEVPEVLAAFPGCRTAKVKVAEPGQTADEDVARVRAVREVLGPEGRIRLDANGRWTLDEAERAVHRLERFDLEYLEQPCESVGDLVELNRRLRELDIPIALDEAIRKSADPLTAVRAGAGGILVLKAAPLGGVRPALELAAEAGLPAVVSSALDTSVGLAMGAWLAAALPDLDYDCGLGTASLLAADVTEDPLLPRDGAIRVRRVEPDAALLDRYAASPERAEWWRARITRCHALLQPPQ